MQKTSLSLDISTAAHLQNYLTRDRNDLRNAFYRPILANYLASSVTSSQPGSPSWKGHYNWSSHLKPFFDRGVIKEEDVDRICEEAMVTLGIGRGVQDEDLSLLAEEAERLLGRFEPRFANEGGRLISSYGHQKEVKLNNGGSLNPAADLCVRKHRGQYQIRNTEGPLTLLPGGRSISSGEWLPLEHGTRIEAGEYRYQWASSTGLHDDMQEVLDRIEGQVRAKGSVAVRILSFKRPKTLAGSAAYVLEMTVRDEEARSRLLKFLQKNLHPTDPVQASVGAVDEGASVMEFKHTVYQVPFFLAVSIAL